MQKRTALVLGAYALLVAIFAVLHEPWRDEIETWAWAASAHDVSALLHNIRYDPNPPLWFFVLFAVSRLSASLTMLKIVQFLSALFLGGVIATSGSLTKWEKAALLGSYFVLYEYGVIARPYTLIAACTLLIAHCAATRERLFTGAIAYSIAALSSLYGVVAALPFAVAMLWSSRDRRRWIAAAIVIAATALAGAHAASMPADFQFGSVGMHPSPFVDVLSSIASGLIPLPKLQLHFWNSSLFSPAIGVIVLVFLLAASVMALRSSRRGLAVWLLAAGVLTAFSVVTGAGAARHRGFYFVAFIGAVIVARERDANAARRFLSLLLIPQCAAAVIACAIDATQPFSRIEDAARYVRARVPADALVVGLPDTVTAPVAFLAGRDFHFANGDRDGRTVIWDSRRRVIDAAMLERRIDAAFAAGHRVFVITNRPIGFAGLQLRPAAVFAPSIVENESFIVAEAQRSAGQRPQAVPAR